MPVARIITSAANECGQLESDLRARGFEIEKVSPNDNPTEPADLEISLEEFSVDEVLSRAAEAAHANDISVFIAPGAITDTPRPVDVIRLWPEPEIAAEPQVIEEIHLTALAESAEVVSPRLTSVEAQEAQPVLMQSTSEEEMPLVQCNAPAEETASELAELVMELETVMPDITAQQQPVEAIAEAREIPDEVPEPVLFSMDDAESNEPPVSDWPIWNPPLHDHIAPSAPVMQSEPIPSAQPESASARSAELIAAMDAAASSLRGHFAHAGSSLRGRFANDPKLFWRVAAVTGVAAVLMLAVGASWHRRSPLPSPLRSTVEANSPALPVESSPILPASSPNSRPSGRNSATPPPLRQIVARRPVSSYADEQDLVARDTVVRFNSPSTNASTKRVTHLSRRKSAPRRSSEDMVAKDTTVRYAGSRSQSK